MNEELRKFAEEKTGKKFLNYDYDIDVDILQDIEKLLNIDIEEDEKDLDLLVEQELKTQEKERELLAKEIVKQQTKEDKKLYNKEDIMNIFSCESDKALRILRLAHKMKYAIKIGKEYYISKIDFKAFLDQIKGRNTII